MPETDEGTQLGGTEVPDKVADSEAALDEEATSEPAPEINTVNEFFVGFQMGVIRPGHYPACNTKQQALRFAAWVVASAEVLPDDEGQPFTFDEYLTAIQNS
jgi:hypothetical protein